MEDLDKYKARQDERIEMTKKEIAECDDDKKKLKKALTAARKEDKK